MRVVFVNRIAWPDEGATAIYVTEAAEAVAAAGHETHVVTGEAAYRAAGAARRPPRVRNGVRYHRLPGRRGERLLGRGLASVAFLARASIRLLTLPRPDVVVALTDPPFLDVVATSLARLRGARAVCWLMDVYPDVAAAAGVLRPGSLVERALSRLHAYGLRRASAVVVLGRAMRRPVLERGVPRSRIRVIENWAPAEVVAASDARVAERPARPVTLLYSGTCGRGHDLAPLFDALRRLPADAPLRVVFQAAGARLAEVREQARSLSVPVEFRPPVPRERLAASLLDGDVHVVSVRAGYERLLVPSKVYAPLRLGLPLLVTGPRSSEPARLLRRGAPGAHLDDLVGGDDDLVARLRALARERHPLPARSGPHRWVVAVEALAARRLVERFRRPEAPALPR